MKPPIWNFFTFTDGLTVAALLLGGIAVIAALFSYLRRNGWL